MAYSPALAHKCAAMSAQVYQPYFDGKCPSVRDDPNQAFFSLDGTQVWLVNEPEAIFVVFRGTSYEDIRTDLKFRKEETDFGKVHRGFWNYTLNTFMGVGIWLTARAFIQKKPIILTGHSLGAAAAVIQACLLHQQGFGISGVYTFGEPRIGNGQFARYCENAFGDVHYRHVNGLDGVPMIPPWHWGYRHCGQRFYFSTHRQRLVRNAPLCQVVLERLPILLKRPWKWGAYKIIDHAVAGYVGACERNL